MPAHDPTADFDPNRATADPPAAGSRTTPHAPTDTPAHVPEIPGYEVECEIARGGMGVVYRARHLRLNRPSAIKMILGGRYQDPTARVRFLIEAEAVAALDHPHVVHVHEFGTHDGLPFFALEYVAGGTLADRLKRSKFAPRAAAVLVAKLADGVAAAHAKGIVHRDLKPANVLLIEAGEPKVTDFGLAKVGGSAVTATGAVMGTPSYMAPEQAAGRSNDVGTHTDVYALGAILYELLTGRPPFLAETAMATIQDVLSKEPVRPRAIDPAAPRDLETICLKCLAKKPAKRYATTAELRADLAAYLDDRPISARPVGAAERAWKWARRNPGRAAAVAAGLLVLIVAGAASYAVARQREADREQARADALVDALVNADIENVPYLLADADAPLLDRARPRLRENLSKPVGTNAGLHCRLALLADDASLAPEVAHFVIHGWPKQMLPVRERLVPHAGVVAPQLWKVLEDAVGGRETIQLRAACLLAAMTPDDPRWAKYGPPIGATLTKEPAESRYYWGTALAPVMRYLVPGIVDQYFLSRDRIASGKLPVHQLVEEALAYEAAGILFVEHTGGMPEVRAELLASLDGPNARSLIGFTRQPEKLLPLLRGVLAEGPKPNGAAVAAVIGAAGEGTRTVPDEALVAVAKRRAAAAFALLEFGEPEPAWEMLRHSPDPTARSYLVERLGGVAEHRRDLVRRFRTESDVSARRALLLALGDTDQSRLGREWERAWDAERDEFVKELLALYRTHPDPGLHSAIDWLLREQWGMAKEVAAIDAELAKAAIPVPPAGKDWFVNGQGQTFAVVRGPVEFSIGSPLAEPDRSDDELPLRRRIPRSFAVATKEVTVDQFLRYKQGHEWSKAHSPGPDTPVVGVTWFDCAGYCNWLSERDGIPQDQWCYEPTPGGRYADGMRLKAGHLNLNGYRLPTEAEWEFVARGGATTSRHYGRGRELLPRYAWTMSNSDRRAHPVGTLRPNDCGLFDPLGNAFEWCDTQAADYRLFAQTDAGSSSPQPVDERKVRVLRGGSFVAFAEHVRSAYRYYYPPPTHNQGHGFRPARTIMK